MSSRASAAAVVRGDEAEAVSWMMGFFRVDERWSDN